MSVDYFLVNTIVLTMLEVLCAHVEMDICWMTMDVLVLVRFKDRFAK